jgi:hypothetical protein
LKSIKLSLIFLVVIFSACSNRDTDPGDRTVARAYGAWLLQSELSGIVPEDASPSDSIAIINSYINNWIRNQLLLHQAEKNLTSGQKDFSKQLNDYRNSLVIYKYESELVRQNLDSLISVDELEAYYESNTDNFVLKEDIVQFVYLKVSEDVQQIEDIRRLLNKGFAENQDSVSFYAVQFCDDYAMMNEQWIPLSRLLSVVPIQTEDVSTIFDNDVFVEYYSKPHYHFIYFTGYKLKGDISPFEYEIENIKLILLNRRKKMLIKDMHNEIYEQARQNNDFEYF